MVLARTHTHTHTHTRQQNRKMRETRNERPLIWSINLQQRRQENTMEKSLFNKLCWENWIAICKRVKIDYFFTPHTKVNSKCIKYLNASLETIKLLKENIGSMLSDISLSNFFKSVSP